jgi:hypothetical protein
VWAPEAPCRCVIGAHCLLDGVEGAEGEASTTGADLRLEWALGRARTPMKPEELRQRRGAWRRRRCAWHARGCVTGKRAACGGREFSAVVGARRSCRFISRAVKKISAPFWHVCWSVIFQHQHAKLAVFTVRASSGAFVEDALS